MARLKVFAWSNGLKTYAVATTSRPKALEAWGINQDMFKEGLAHEVEDPALIEAATAQPGVVVVQPAGGGKAKAVVESKAPSKPKAPSAAQRRVADLKAQVAALETVQRDEVESLAAERRAFEARASAMIQTHEAAMQVKNRLRAAQAKL